MDVAAFIEKEEEAEERFQAGINKYKLGFRQGSTIGYSDFHNLMGFTSKKMPNNIL